MVLVAALVGLATGGQHPAHTAAGQPFHGGIGVGQEHVHERGVSQALGDALDVGFELLARVGRDDAGLQLVAVVVGQDGGEILEEVIEGEAEQAAGEGRVAAPLGSGSFFQDQDLAALLAGGQRGGECGVAGAHDDYIR